ncbi:retrovirus-related pol polyprotein from transposon TNT 1-94 [Tanacetum coccineum]
MPTEIELALEQTQQGASYEVSIVIMDPVMQCITLPQPLKVSQKTLVSFLTEITRISIDFLTPKHQSDTKVITMMMEILPEPTSNKLCDLLSLALDEIIGNLKVHEVVMEKDFKIYRGKKERVKSITLKAKKESSDDETLTSGSDDEEYAMAVRNFKKFFRRNGKFVRQPREEKKSFRQRDEKKGKSDRKCFRCGDPNHLIGDCPKPPRNKDQKAFIGGSWSDSENDAEDKTNDETCLMAQSSNEVCLRTCLEPDEWIKDSGCSKHMTGNKSLFSTYKAYDGGNVVFGSNLKGKIIGKGTISNDSLTISNVEHVDNLTFNLLSVSQICDNKWRVLFMEEGSEIIKDGKIIGNGIRKNGL